MLMTLWMNKGLDKRLIRVMFAIGRLFKGRVVTAQGLTVVEMSSSRRLTDNRIRISPEAINRQWIFVITSGTRIDNAFTHCVMERFHLLPKGPQYLILRVSH